MKKNVYKGYLSILKEELLPAMGCTEPISLAYAAALARSVLGALPERVEISVSGNILKNVKSVIVPNTGGLKGVTAAAAAGIVAGNAESKLQVLSEVTDSEKQAIKTYLAATPFTVNKARSECVFDIGVKVFSGGDDAYVRIEGHHTNVVTVEKNGKRIVDGKLFTEECRTDRSILNVCDIIEFANEVKLCDVEEIINRQIEYNYAIAQEGLKNDYGANVGKVLLKAFGNDVHNLAKATAAAGSDARMNG